MIVGGGFGSRGFGAGSIKVLRAVAVDGQTVRVVFNMRPRFRSPIGSSDALNVSNYRFAVLAPGTGATPTPVGVKQQLVQGPAYGPVMAGQWAVDVQVDRPLVTALSFRVTVTNIEASAGDTLGFPDSADFPGVVLLHAAAAPSRDLGNTDVASDPFSGGFVFPSSGDIGNHTGLAGLRKRVFRRLATPKNAFRHLPGYGLGQPFKKPASARNLGALKTDAIQQLKQEPEVADAAVTVTLQTLAQASVLTTTARLTTKTGAIAEFNVQQSSDGRIVVSS